MKASKGGFGKLQNRVSVINVAPNLRKSGVNLLLSNLYTPPCHLNSLPKGPSNAFNAHQGWSPTIFMFNVLYNQKINPSQSDLQFGKWSFCWIFFPAVTLLR